ncbi:hypothetical protein GOODEAATRI_030899, partial [Goodea atripinnis]
SFYTQSASCQQLLPATSTASHMGQAFYLRLARLGAHQPYVKPPLVPEYQLSTCQKDSEEEPLPEVLFTLLFFFFSFIKSRSLSKTDILRMWVLVDL